MKPTIITLTGPSCAGKTHLEAQLANNGFARVISTTTRKSRVGEKHGQAYYFTDTVGFESLVEAGRMVEHVKFNGNYYGVSKEEIERVAATGAPIVVVVEPEGLKQMRAYAQREGWNIFSLFVDNPESVRLQRFMRRTLEDAYGQGEQRMHIGGLDTLAESAVKRLTVMMTTEQRWSAEATGQMNDLYDMVLREYNEQNAKVAVEFLVNVGNFLQGKEEANPDLLIALSRAA